MQILVTPEIAARGESRFTNQLIYVLYLCAYMHAEEATASENNTRAQLTLSASISSLVLTLQIYSLCS